MFFITHALKLYLFIQQTTHFCFTFTRYVNFYWTA